MPEYRSPSNVYQSVRDPEGRRQQIAQFEASLSALRRELNLWWDRNEGGAKSSEPPQLLAIRSRVRESAELERGIQR
jgi:hypothetical protein